MSKCVKDVENRRSYFVTTSGKKVIVEKLHLCSWLFHDAKEFLEVGLQIKFDQDLMIPKSTVDLTLWMPWVKKEGVEKTKVFDLYDALIDRRNCQFIFNEEARGVDNFEGQKEEDGKLVRFFNNETLCVLKANASVDDMRVNMSLKIPDDHGGTKIGDHLYARILLDVPSSNFSLRQKCISKTIYSYDVKVNEPRNHPESPLFHVEEICPVEKLFSLHIVPSNFSLSFLDHNAFRNVRILEKASYEKYVQKVGSVLPANVKKGSLIVIFNKRSVSDVKNASGSFLSMDKIQIVPGSSFSVFEVDSVGYYQVVLAIVLNYVSSLFFYLISLSKDNAVWVWPISRVAWAVVGMTLGLSCASWLLVRKQVKWWVFLLNWIAIVGALSVLAKWVII